MSDIRCINLSYVVPEDKADEVQSVFNKHSAWMDDFYSDSNNGSEHLINSYFTRAPELNNAPCVDPTAGVTGNVIFTLNERFTSMESVGRHFASAQENDYFPKFGEILQMYGTARSMGGEIYHSIR